MKPIHFLLSLLSLNLAFGVTSAVQEEKKIKVSELPAAVAQILKTECPDCQIDKLTREVENGVTIYDFEFKHGKGEMDITPDGIVVSRETLVQINDLPPAARDAIQKGAARGRVLQVLREQVRAELADGKVIKLDPPKYLYEADLADGDQIAEIVVSPEGQVVEAPVWRKRTAKES
jgi:hypothetical protein